MFKKLIARALLFLSLSGYGLMMGPRQVGFTRTRDVHAMWTVVFAASAVIGVALLIEEVKKATRGDGQ